jgi:2-methylcitrate dehydratase PrpD
MVSAEVDLAKGEPENPATHEDMFKKFYRNATMILSTSQTTKLGRIIMSLEDYSLSDMLQFINIYSLQIAQENHFNCVENDIL